MSAGSFDLRLKICPSTNGTSYTLRGLEIIKELDTVVLMEDLPEHALTQGNIGTVVLMHQPAGYEVEFMTRLLDGETLAIVSLMPEQICPTGR